VVIDDKYRTLLIDASYLAYRAFYALPELVPGQTSVHMVYGFLISLVSTVKKFPVEELLIVWDAGHEVKSKVFDGYKKKDDVMSAEQRADFISQFKLLDNFLVWLGIKCCYQRGYEADDIIAHLCQQGHVLGADGARYVVKKPILISSGDHDLHPLLSEDVSMWKLHKELVYTIDVFRQEYPALEPRQYQEMQALMGCSGDKVPGVRGVGPKRAADLIRKYGSVEGVRASQDGDRIVKLVQENWEAVELSARLVAFESVKPTLISRKPDLSRLRKHLFTLSMDSLIADWVDITHLSEL